MPAVIAGLVLATVIDAFAFGACFSFAAVLFCATLDACIIDALGLDACLTVIACDGFAGIDVDAFAAFVAVATRLVGACLVCTRIFGFAFLIDAFLCFGAFRAGIVIIRFVDACLGVFVADFVICADLVATKVFAGAVYAFLVVFADIAATEVFADLVYTFLAFRACVAWIGLFVLAGAVHAFLVSRAFGARILGIAFIFAFAVHAFLVFGAHGIAAFRFALLADSVAVVTACCKRERHRGTAGECKPSF